MNNPTPSFSRLIRSVFGLSLLLLVTSALVLLRPVTAGNSVPADATLRHDSSKGLTPAGLTFTVNTLGDAPDTNIGDGICDTGAGGNQCSLRAAIQETNFASSDDTINFSLPLYSTITLNTALPAVLGNITIAGPGVSVLTIQRNLDEVTPNFRFFAFVPINGNFNNSISNLTFYNGHAPTGGGFASGQGGSLFNSSSCTLALNNVIIRDSRATTGGAVYNAGTATFYATQVLGGNAENGGGIYNSGTLTLNYSTATGNSTIDGGSGGAIFNQSGTVSLMNTVISSNATANGTSSSSPGGDGGGIYSAGTLTLINSTVSENFTGNGGAAASGGYGGGIYNTSSLVLTNSLVSGNRTGSGLTAGGGGGIMNGGSATLNNSTISGNQIGSNNQGSGIYNYGTLILGSATICNNNGGSGILNSAGASLRDTIVANNQMNGLNSDLAGTFSSQDYNLIKTPDGATINGATTHNIIGQDPRLGPLADQPWPDQNSCVDVW